MSDKELVIYKEFQHWCAKNPSYDLDPRLHQHSGSIENGGYIAHEKTRVAFAAYRASSPVLAPPVAVPEGWDIQRTGDEIAINNVGGPDLLLYRVPGPDSYPSNVLFDLCEAMVTAGDK